jgi:hypothetical protein
MQQNESVMSARPKRLCLRVLSKDDGGGHLFLGVWRILKFAIRKRGPATCSAVQCSLWRRTWAH